LLQRFEYAGEEEEDSEPEPHFTPASPPKPIRTAAAIKPAPVLPKPASTQPSPAQKPTFLAQPSHSAIFTPSALANYCPGTGCTQKIPAIISPELERLLRNFHVLKAQRGETDSSVAGMRNSVCKEISRISKVLDLGVKRGWPQNGVDLRRISGLAQLVQFVVPRLQTAQFLEQSPAWQFLFNDVLGGSLSQLIRLVEDTSAATTEFPRLEEAKSCGL
jgi:hypothetical protein